MRSSLALFLVIGCTVFITACGGGSTPAPSPVQTISVAVTPTSVNLIAGATQQFTARVTGSTNTAVTWLLTSSGCSGAGCGTITSTGLYTAPTPVPSSIAVSVVATAAADTTKSSAATANLIPVSVSISPATGSVYQRDMMQFTASVSGASDNSVTWSINGLIGGGCSTGYVWPSGMYTTSYCDISNPPQTFTIKATSNADSTQSGTAQVTVTGASPYNTKMKGDYALLFRGYDNDGPVALAGRFNADGTGSIIGGELALNSVSRTLVMSSSGSYSIGSDNRGTMSLGEWTFRFVVDSRGKMRIINFDGTLNNPIRGSGEIKEQDASAFSLNAFNGPFTLGLNGDLNGNGMAILGKFDFDNTGSVSGVVDSVSPTANLGSLQLTGTFAAPDPLSGYGTGSFTVANPPTFGAHVVAAGTTYNLAYFVISASEAYMVQMDPRSATVPVLSGSLLQRSGSPFSDASMSTPTVVQLMGPTSGGSHVILGQAVFDGSGYLSGMADENRAGDITAKENFSGTYSVDTNGRGTAEVTLSSGGSTSFTFYLVSPGKAFMVGGTPATPAGEVVTGMVEPQAGGPFTLASIAGTYAMGTLAPATNSVPAVSATATVGSSGGFNGMQDMWTTWSTFLGDPMDGTITLVDATSGRGTITPCPPMDYCGAAPFYIVSPTKLLEMEWAAGNDARIQAYEQ